jgi:hypothetical protein
MLPNLNFTNHPIVIIIKTNRDEHMYLKQLKYNNTNEHILDAVVYRQKEESVEG